MKPRRDAKYLQWIRTLPCVVCGSRRNIEAAHTGQHGLGQKAPDYTAIPLCVTHHRISNDSYHKLGQRRFADAHNLDIPQIATRLSSKPRIQIISGAFIGHVQNQEYLLGPTHLGISRAIQALIELRRMIGDEEDWRSRALSPFSSNRDT